MRAGTGAAVRLAVEGPAEAPVIRVGAAESGAAAEAVLARAEALTAEDAAVRCIRVEAADDVSRSLIGLGAARRAPAGVEILPGLLWQCAARWLPEPRPPSRRSTPSPRGAATRCGPRRPRARSTPAASPGSAAPSPSAP
ncbi:hypothetical protein [Methylobacterium gregans]|uniref:hypothetical protein n=1 Tax=Methylobacterium gregans TaxID=374424 RepID=UPI0036067B4D